jgi:hypothetical protein
MRKWTWVLAQLESSIEVLYSFDRRAAAVMECRSGLGAGQKMAERPQVNLSTNASKVPSNLHPRVHGRHCLRSARCNAGKIGLTCYEPCLNTVEAHG